VALGLRWLILGAAVAVAVLLLSIPIGGASTEAQEGQKAARSPTPTKTTKTSVGTIHRDPPSVLSRHSTTTPEESAALERGLQKLREQLDAANAKRQRGGGAALDAPVGRPSKQRGGGAALDAPVGRPSKMAAKSKALFTTKNRRNTVAQQVSLTLAEPAAAADEREVLYAGNTYQSRSTDRGATWVNAGAYPAGPPDAPNVCCDPDVVHASNTDTTFNTIVYTNGTPLTSPTNSVVRIFVRHGKISGGIDCSYDIDPGGTSDNIIADYPHIATSNKFLYLSTNNFSPTKWVGAQTRRFDLKQMSNCQQQVSSNTFTYDNTSIGHRVHVPVENATTTMYWGQLDDATTFRIYSWPDSQTTPSQVTRSVASTEFTNPDCRGGTGDFDWIERSTSWTITGFRMRGAIAGRTVQFLWAAAPDSQHTQAHLHGAVFRTSDLALIAQPRVFNNNFCFGFPALGGNARGQYALSVAFGGDKVDNSGTSAQGAVAVDDASSAGYSFPKFETTATGTHNSTDGRFGDYFTVRKNERCPNTWNATNYALSGGNMLAANVNARYVEFQSSKAHRCRE
jgi:hypothetical protein